MTTNKAKCVNLSVVDHNWSTCIDRGLMLIYNALNNIKNVLMTGKLFTLLFNAVKGIEGKIHLLLLQKYMWENTDKANDREILISLPLRINFLLHPQNKILFSAELMQHIRLNKQEISSLQHFALQKKMPTQDALLALIKEIVLDDQNTKTIIERYQVKKKQIRVEVNVWKDLVIQL